MSLWTRLICSELSINYLIVMYTVVHKKFTTFIFGITLANLGLFLPRNYDNCVNQNPPVFYKNIEKVVPTIDTVCEPDCGMMGYDVPPPMHVYSEIPGSMMMMLTTRKITSMTLWTRQ